MTHHVLNFHFKANLRIQCTPTSFYHDWLCILLNISLENFHASILSQLCELLNFILPYFVPIKQAPKANTVRKLSSSVGVWIRNKLYQYQFPVNLVHILCVSPYFLFCDEFYCWTRWNEHLPPVSRKKWVIQSSLPALHPHHYPWDMLVWTEWRGEMGIHHPKYPDERIWPWHQQLLRLPHHLPSRKTIPIYLRVLLGEEEIHIPWRARKDHGMNAAALPLGVYLLPIHPVLEIPPPINPENHRLIPREQGGDQADRENRA